MLQEGQFSEKMNLKVSLDTVPHLSNKYSSIIHYMQLLLRILELWVSNVQGGILKVANLYLGHYLLFNKLFHCFKFHLKKPTHFSSNTLEYF